MCFDNGTEVPADICVQGVGEDCFNINLMLLTLHAVSLSNNVNESAAAGIAKDGVHTCCMARYVFIKLL